jgi:predicted O-methyltransferase YrrM
MQHRAMSRSSHCEVRSIAETLAARRAPAVAARIAEIERYREYLCSRGAALRYGVPQDRMIEIATRGSKSPRWASLILDLIVALKPARVLEMGTAAGVSGAYIAAGLEANGGGELVTVESMRQRYRIARGTFADLGLAPYVTAVHGTFDDTLDSLVDDGLPFDFAFKDGAHTRSATTGWFDRLAPVLADGSAFLFDDIRRDQGMRDAWEEIRRRPRVFASVDFYGLGLVLLTSEDHATAEAFQFGVE